MQQRRMRGMFWLGGALVLGVSAGLAAGIGGYTFIYAHGASYLTYDPAACANCHIMHNHYDAWLKSSHHTVAVCNDCHTPADFFAKYFIKGLNGYHHSMAFTLQNFREPIQITARNREITENACRKCHQDIVDAIDHGGGQGEHLACIRCHAHAGHLE